MMSVFPVCCRASLMAKSLASEPELTKKQTDSDSGILDTSFSAHTTRLSCKNRLLVFNCCICSTPAFTTSGWQWPTVNINLKSFEKDAT